MTTFQDPQPQSRRALRQEERDERPDTPVVVDAPSETAAPRPSGRRARAAAPDGLVDVSNTSETAADESVAAEPVTAEPAVADPAVADPAVAEQVVAESAPVVDEPAEAEPLSYLTAGREPTPEWTGPSFGSNAAAAPPVIDSAIPKAFPFADQVEATSDDAGHPSFRLRDFSPEVAQTPVASQSAHDWTPDGDDSAPLEYQTQGGPAQGYVSPYASSKPVDAEPVDSEPVDGEPVDGAPVEAAPVEAAPVEAAPVEAAPAFEAPANVDAPAVEAPTAEAPVAQAAPEEHTLSRREWRAMRAAAEAAENANAPVIEPFGAAAAGAAAGAAQSFAAEPFAAQSFAVQPVAEQPFAAQPDVAAQPAQVASPEAAPAEPSGIDIFFQEPEAGIPPLVEPETAPHNALPQSAVSDAMAEFEALTNGAQTYEAPAAPFTNPAFTAPASASSTFTSPVFISPEAPAPDQVEQAPVQHTVPPVESAAATPFSFMLTPMGADAPAAAPQDSQSYTPPVGHWSRQAELDDESQPFENTLSRDVGGGNVATTTNALVLPMLPQRDDFSSVLNATGEIMITGTINLPGSVGATGRDSRHYDDPGVDHLFDAFDTEVSNTDSAPVRAITAVSSHTASRGGIESSNKQSNRMLTVLLVTASVMAVGVVGLLFAGFVFHIF